MGGDESSIDRIQLVQRVQAVSKCHAMLQLEEIDENASKDSLRCAVFNWLSVYKQHFVVPPLED